MKHRRGITLGRSRAGEIVYLGPLMDPVNTTLDDIPESHALGAYCSKCEREAWLLRWEIERKW